MPSKRRRAYGEGSITRNARGLWVGKLEAGYTYSSDGTPKRRRLEKSSKSHAIVVTWLAAAKADIARYGRTADPAITVAKWGGRWLTEICAPKLKPTSMETYTGNMRRWIVPTIGRKRLAKLTPADVRAVTQAVRDAGRTSTTARSVFTTLSAMLEAARREGLLMENVAGRVDPPKVAESSRGSLSAVQAHAVLSAATTLPGGSLYIALLLTGMRHSEALGLTWEHVDLDAGYLTVAWQLKQIPRQHGCGDEHDDAWPCGYKNGGRCPKSTLRMPDGMPYRYLTKTYVLVPTKSSKARTVPMLPPLVAALRQHQIDDVGQPNPYNLVWHHPSGIPLDADTDRVRWAELVDTVGIPRAVTPHWARHSVATLLMEAGVDVKVIGEIVGHANAAITRSTYQHVSGDLARAGMAKFGELLAG